MKKLFLSCIILILLGLGCSKSDDSQEDTKLDSSKPFSVVALVDGKKFEAQGYGFILAEYLKQDNGLYQFKFLAATDTNDSNEYQRILIRVILPGPNYFNEDLGVTDNQEGSFSNPLAIYHEVESGTGLLLENADTAFTRISSFNITELDPVKKTISGTFRFTASSTIFNRVYEVKSGVFNKIEYKDSTEN